MTADGWVLVQRNSKMAQRIAAISALLDTIVHQVRQLNLPPAKQVLTEIEGQQLVAIIETILAVLKAPLVEKGLLQRAVNGLQRAAEKGVQGGIGTMASEAAKRLVEILKGLI